MINEEIILIITITISLTTKSVISPSEEINHWTVTPYNLVSKVALRIDVLEWLAMRHRIAKRDYSAQNIGAHWTIAAIGLSSFVLGYLELCSYSVVLYLLGKQAFANARRKNHQI